MGIMLYFTENKIRKIINILRKSNEIACYGRQDLNLSREIRKLIDELETTKKYEY